MIFDNIKNSSFYYNLEEKIKIALKYLQENDLSQIENGKYEILGKDIFVIIQEYETKKQVLCRWEAHKNYIDIQFIIKGREQIGFANIADFSNTTEYDEEKDIIFLEGNGNTALVEQGFFMLLTPEDAHMPCIAAEKPEYVKKAVVKIKV